MGARSGLPPQSGFALVAALLAIILVTALLAALFFAVNQDTRTESAIEQRDEALAAAESAIQIGLDQLGTRAVDYLAVGAAASQSVAVDGFPAVIYTTRLDSGLFWIVAVVGDAGDRSTPTRRIGILARAFRGASDSIAIVRISERGWSELF